MSGASSYELENPEARGVVTVAPQPHPSAAAAPHELAHAPQAAGEHLINDEVETHAAARVGIGAGRPRDRCRHAIAGVGTAPGAAHRPIRPASVAGHARTDGVTVLIRNDEIPNRSDA